MGSTGGINMKYKVGDKIIHFTGIHGMITRVLLDTNSYYFVYVEDGGKIIRIEIDECEIQGCSEYDYFGFHKNKA